MKKKGRRQNCKKKILKKLREGEEDFFRLLKVERNIERGRYNNLCTKLLLLKNKVFATIYYSLFDLIYDATLLFISIQKK